MWKMSKRMMFLAAVGQGALFSLALTGFVRIGFWLSGQNLEQAAADRLFVISSLLTGALAATLYGLKLRRAGPDSSS